MRLIARLGLLALLPAPSCLFAQSPAAQAPSSSEPAQHSTGKAQPPRLFFKIQHDTGSSTSFSYVPALQPGEAGGNEEADQLIHAAFDSIQIKNLDAAQKSLDRARALNPEQLGLWSVSAFLARKRNAWSEMTTDLQTELKNHPDQTNLYPMLTSLENSYGTQEDLIASLRAWVVAQSTYLYPRTALMDALTKNGEPDAAVAVGEAALSGFSRVQLENMEFQLALATAQLKAGRPATELDALRANVKTSKDLYGLIDLTSSISEPESPIADLLPIAESAARHGIDILTQTGEQLALEDNVNPLLANTRFLESFWDNLGCVLFREGKLTEAEAYIKASWNGSHTASTAEDLGEIELARGDKTAALDAFELALAKEITYDSKGQRNPPTKLEKQIQAHIDELQIAGVKPSEDTADWSKRLSDSFKTSLGPAGKRSGSAEYRLFLKHGKVVNAEPNGITAIPDVQTILSRADFSNLFAPDSTATLFHLAHINCQSGACELVLEP